MKKEENSDLELIRTMHVNLVNKGLDINKQLLISAGLLHSIILSAGVTLGPSDLSEAISGVINKKSFETEKEKSIIIH